MHPVSCPLALIHDLVPVIRDGVDVSIPPACAQSPRERHYQKIEVYDIGRTSTDIGHSGGVGHPSEQRADGISSTSMVQHILALRYIRSEQRCQLKVCQPHHHFPGFSYSNNTMRSATD